MKIFIAAVIASAFSVGAFAQSASAPAAATPMAKPLAADSGMKKAPAHKATRKPGAKKAMKTMKTMKTMKKASAPA